MKNARKVSYRLNEKKNHFIIILYGARKYLKKSLFSCLLHPFSTLTAAEISSLPEIISVPISANASPRKLSGGERWRMNAFHVAGIGTSCCVMSCHHEKKTGIICPLPIEFSQYFMASRTRKQTIRYKFNRHS